MQKIIKRYTVATTAKGAAGLSIPHLWLGDIIDAQWEYGAGLNLRCTQGVARVEVTSSDVRKHWAGESLLRIVESTPGRMDAAWMVPLHGAPAR